LIFYIQLEHYEKDIEAKKENESSRLENLRHQNLESTEKARRYFTKKIPPPKSLGIKFFQL